MFGLLFCLFVQQENGYRISQLLVSDDEKKGLFTLLPMYEYVQLKERMNLCRCPKIVLDNREGTITIKTPGFFSVIHSLHDNTICVF